MLLHVSDLNSLVTIAASRQEKHVLFVCKLKDDLNITIITAINDPSSFIHSGLLLFQSIQCLFKVFWTFNEMYLLLFKSRNCVLRNSPLTLLECCSFSSQQRWCDIFFFFTHHAVSFRFPIGVSFLAELCRVKHPPVWEICCSPVLPAGPCSPWCSFKTKADLILSLNFWTHTLNFRNCGHYVENIEQDSPA